LKSTIVGLLLEFNVFKTSTTFPFVAVVVTGIVTVGAGVVGADVVGADVVGADVVGVVRAGVVGGCVVGAGVVATQSKSLQGQPTGQFFSILQLK